MNISYIVSTGGIFIVVKNKRLAIQLLIDKQSNALITYESISSRTGYSKRQLIRMYSTIQNEKDLSSLYLHGNVGKEPVNKASSSEIDFFITLKDKYPKITISQFRDIFIEDILLNPDKAAIVQKYNLKDRSKSWFRDLFLSQKWKSPEARKICRRDNRALHPLRKPSTQRGMLVQIDGTPYDWFGNGQMWTLHLAVDDATSEVLAGYFMPTERQLGYCHMMRLILEKYGIPMALYSDKHTIFKSSKDDSLTQFGAMMEDLGIEFIFANTPQAKGRIERYNGSVQRRLPNDIIRFGIKNYDELNNWFNLFYISYINKKFSFIPLDPHDAFVPLDDYDLGQIFTQRFTRTINSDMFSINGNYYCLINNNGEKMHIINDTKVSVRIDVFTEEIKVLRYGKLYNTVLVSDKKRTKDNIVSNQKELQDYLNNIRKK